MLRAANVLCSVAQASLQGCSVLCHLSGDPRCLGVTRYGSKTFGIVLLRTRLRRPGLVGDLFSSVLPFTWGNCRSKPLLHEYSTYAICIDLTGLMLCLSCLPTNSASPFQNLGMIACSCLQLCPEPSGGA